MNLAIENVSHVEAVITNIVHISHNSIILVPYTTGRECRRK